MSAADAATTRVVVTGCGVVTPVGTTRESFWTNVVAGRSGVAPIESFDASGFATTFAAEVRCLDASRLPEDPRLQSVLERKDRLGWIAAIEALADAGVEVGNGSRDRFGTSIGTERRRPDLLQRMATGARFSDRLDWIRNAPFALASALASAFQLHGPQLNVVAACASGAQAIGLAFEKLRWREADVMLAGGCDSLVDPVMLAAFSGLSALSRRNDDPAGASRPFDKGRDGFVLGEGAGMLVLEALDHALARKARIYGEILGYSSSSNADRFTDSPDDGGTLCAAITNALSDAHVAPEAIDYINAHGTSTQQNDRSETAAIKRCFGAAAPSIPISATKSMTGHMVCASGAVEVIVSLLTIRDGIIHPTINQVDADPLCNLDYVPNTARRKEVDTVLSTSSGFGGINTGIVVGRLCDGGR